MARDKSRKEMANVLSRSWQLIISNRVKDVCWSMSLVTRKQMVTLLGERKKS